MAQRFAGTAFCTVDGNQLALRGNFTVRPSVVKREMLAGQDRVHGYRELPVIPSIEGDISLVQEMSTEEQELVTDSTVVAQLANGHTYVLRNAVVDGDFELNTNDGQMRVKWEGEACDEI